MTAQRGDGTRANVTALLAEPYDAERRMYRSLPAVVHGVMLPVRTSCGIVSRSASQTADAVARARRLAPSFLEHLTDDDVLWLLLNDWSPR